MATGSVENSEYRLLLIIESRALPVSYVSRTLRVIQAAVREVARGVGGGDAMFEGQPQPALLLDVSVLNGSEIEFSLYFADPADDTPMPELSTQAFEPFMEEFGFGELLKQMPQRGLWGRMARQTGSHRLQTEAARRLDELRVELRHFRKAVLMHRSRSITFDGDQMEIE
ncbi:hypothetical protein GBAR_LOCUS18597 [Geodia barretti]|uniref:Uncharacterized protein n=1 Tax=Geodia barretti TaxID=519541 RepID=A0AA35WY13_GEOBA|nr:hypothetical protein GBAR_LOCUS18597 [Geodia barretti]